MMLTDLAASGKVAELHMGHAFAVAFTSKSSSNLFVPTATGIRAITGEPHPLGNFAVGLAEEEISSTAAALKEANHPSAMFIEGQERSAVTATLADYQFSHHGAMPAMAVDLSSFQEPPQSAFLRVEVLDLKDAQAVRQWEKVMELGFELPARLASLFGPSNTPMTAPVEFYRAILDGETVGCSLLVQSGGVAGIYCVATMPEHRGKGIGAAVTSKPLVRAREKGYRVGVLQASKMGYSIYRKLGFVDVGELQMYFRLPDIND